MEADGGVIVTGPGIGFTVTVTCATEVLVHEVVNEISSSPKSLPFKTVSWFTMDIVAVVLLPEFQVVVYSIQVLTLAGALITEPKITPFMENLKLAKF